MEKKLRHCSTFIIADTDAVDLVAEVLPLDLRVSHHLKVNEVQSFCHHFFNFCNHHLTCNVFVIIFSIFVNHHLELNVFILLGQAFQKLVLLLQGKIPRHNLKQNMFCVLQRHELTNKII